MAGFKLRKNLDGSSASSHALLEITAANSIVVQKGDLVRVNTGGFGALVTTGDVIVGVVAGVVDSKGLPIDPDSGTRDVYTMASDNQTVAQKKIQYIPALPQYLFYNDADDTLAQSNLFQYFDVNDENDVDVATGHDSTVSQVQLVQIDPDGDADASKGLFRIVESVFAQSVGSGGIEA